jgi:hypothetical protein
MQIKKTLCAFATGLCMTAYQATADINWLTGVADGYYNQAANWTGGVIPTNNTIGAFTGNQTYTIRFPAGGYAENCVTKVYLSSGRSLTFDTRGTWWLKDAPTITNGWPNGWTGFQISNSGGSHLFNIEGLSSSYTATNYPVMCLSNAVFRYFSSATVSNVLEEGLLNLYDPKGVKYNQHTLITGSAGTRHVALFKTNSTLRANQIRMRGTTAGNIMIFEGGNHAIYGGLQLGEGATGAYTTNTVQVTGGTLSLPASDLYIGSGKTGSHGDFSVSGFGVVNVTNTIVMASYQSQSSGSLRLSDNAVLRTGNYLDAAATSSSTATIALANSALLSVGSNLAIARGTGSFTTMDLRDQSTCNVGGYLLIGGYSASVGTVSVRDSATLTVAASYVEAGTSSGTGRLELVGGRLVAKNVKGGVGGWSEFYADGGTLSASNISASVNLLVNFDLAELGASGLTLDSSGYDVTVSQPFADASGASGLFLKTGAGTLSASNSTHALTVVAQGGLRVLEASATFGRSLVATNQTSLSLVGVATNLTVGSLTLGEPNAAVSLYLDVGDSIAVTNSSGLTVNACGLFFGAAGVNGTYTLFRCAGAVDPSVLSHLSVFNPAAGKGYTFAVAPAGADSDIQLTVSAFAASDAVWNGSLGSDWNTAANWTPDALPTNGTTAFFTDSAAQKTVSLSAPAVCSYLSFASAAPYLLQGAQLSLPAGGISNSLGSHTLALPLALSGSFSLQSAAASTTTLSGALSAYAGTTISKGGSGSLVVSGDNASLNVLWQSVGGRLQVASASALGVANAATNALTLGAGTFSYSGAPTNLAKGITMSAGSISNAVIFEALSDLTLSAPVVMQPSLFCKRGPAALTMVVGSGTTTLSVGAGSGGVNINPGGTIVLPASGDAPAVPTGLGGFNVLEGLVRIKGNGAGASTVNQQHFGIIGGQYSAAQADPVLELDAVTMNQGSAGQHLLLGNQMSAASPARAPTLRLVNGASLVLDHLRMGVSPATTFAPTLVMSNSTLTAGWQLSIGADNSTFPIVRLRQGSTATATGGNEWGGGILIARNVDIVVAENSVLSQTATGGGQFFRFSDAYSSGTMRFASGGTMRFGRFLGLNYATTAGLNVYFDGGVMEPIASGDSISTAPSKQSFIIEAGGLTIRAGSGVRHAFHFPFTGAGALTKTGVGEAVFGTGWSYAPGATNLSGLATGNYTGGTAVQAGTLSVSNGTIRSDAVVAIAAGARLNLSASAVTLSEVSGSGTVSNGVLYAGYRCHAATNNNDCIALADVTIPAAGLAVTFDLAPGYALTNRQVLAVATRSGTTDLNLSAWSARNVGAKQSAAFTLVGNTVYANVFFNSGTLMGIR